MSKEEWNWDTDPNGNEFKTTDPPIDDDEEDDESDEDEAFRGHENDVDWDNDINPPPEEMYDDDDVAHDDDEYKQQEDDYDRQSSAYQHHQPDHYTGTNSGFDKQEDDLPVSDPTSIVYPVDAPPDPVGIQHNGIEKRIPQEPLPDFPNAVPVDDRFSDEGDEEGDMHNPAEYDEQDQNQTSDKKGGLFGWARKKSQDEDDEKAGGDLEPSSPSKSKKRSWFGKKQKNSDSTDEDGIEATTEDNGDADNNEQRSSSLSPSKRKGKKGLFFRKKGSKRESFSEPEQEQPFGAVLDGENPEKETTVEHGDANSMENGIEVQTFEDEPEPTKKKKKSRGGWFGLRDKGTKSSDEGSVHNMGLDDTALPDDSDPSGGVGENDRATENFGFGDNIETFEDEPETEKKLFGRKKKNKKKKKDIILPVAQTTDEPYPREKNDFEISSHQDGAMGVEEDPERQEIGYRSVATEDWADGSKATSRWSTIEATQERKIITCLTLMVCCFCMLFMLCVGIGIGVAIGKNSNDSGIETSTKAPTAPSVAPVSPPTKAPTLAPTTPSPTATASQSPTPPPTVDPLLVFLIENSFDDGAAIQSAGTPQRNAYNWLASNQNLNDYSDERKLARYALATFYFSTNGPTTWDESIRTDGWLTDEPECEWASSDAADGQCTSGIYTSLTLDYVGVSGEIPLEVGHLTGLTRLSMRNNGTGSDTLTGSIPWTIGSLVNMETVRLSDNQLVGTLPTEIGLMTNLRILLLDGNFIGGNLPTEIGNIYGTTISLDNNEFRGALPVELFQLTNLVSISLENNFFTGSIPTEVGNLGSLSMINLAINDFDGTIPSEIGLLSALRTSINLSDNDLTGPLPSEIGLLAAMREFEVQNNHLTGAIPTSYEQLISIRRFRIDENADITGELPATVCETFLAEPATVSYSDCAADSFTCECCTFCCENGICECNSDDETICADDV